MGSERPEIGSERSDLGSERPDFGSERPVSRLRQGGDVGRKLESMWSNFGSERVWGLRGLI